MPNKFVGSLTFITFYVYDLVDNQNNRTRWFTSQNSTRAN